MKKISLVTWCLGVAGILSLWAICVYDLEILGLPFSYVKGWPKVAKGLAYGVIGGLLIFYLTIRLATHMKRRKIKDSLYAWLASAYVGFCMVPEKLNPKNEKGRILINIQNNDQSNVFLPNSFSDILTHSDWTKRITILKSQITVFEAINYYTSEIKERAQCILNVYSDILSEYEVSCLNGIVTSDLYAHLYFMREELCSKKNYMTFPDKDSKTLPDERFISASDKEENIYPTGELQTVLDCLLSCCKSLNIKSYGDHPDYHTLDFIKRDHSGNGSDSSTKI